MSQTLQTFKKVFSFRNGTHLFLRNQKLSYVKELWTVGLGKHGDFEIKKII